MTKVVLFSPGGRFLKLLANRSIILSKSNILSNGGIFQGETVCKHRIVLYIQILCGIFKNKKKSGYYLDRVPV